VHLFVQYRNRSPSQNEIRLRFLVIFRNILFSSLYFIITLHKLAHSLSVSHWLNSVILISLLLVVVLLDGTDRQKQHKKIKEINQLIGRFRVAKSFPTEFNSITHTQKKILNKSKRPLLIQTQKKLRLKYIRVSVYRKNKQ